MPTTTIRYDEKVRDEAQPLLDSMGMTLNTYLNLAIHQLVVQGRVPFEIWAGSVQHRYRLVEGATPVVRREGNRFVVPAGWDDDDD